MNKKKILSVIRPVIFLILLAAVLLRVYDVLRWKDTMGAYESSMQQLYATPRGLIDAVFMGTSHVYGGVNPDVIWEEYGYACFNMAVSGQDRNSCVHHLKEVLKTQSPRVVMVDIYAAAFERNHVQANVYRNMFALRPSYNAVELICENIPAGERADYLLGFPIVHTRYKELNKYDFVPYVPSVFGRGFCIRYGITEVTHNPSVCLNRTKTALDEGQRRWVEELCALSKEHDFELVLMLLPYEMSLEERMMFNGVFSYGADLGATVLDLNEYREEIGYDYTRDFLDASHLNIYGAEKTSRFLGEVLSGQYALADHRGDPAYEFWERSADFNRHVALEEFFQAMELTEIARLMSTLREVTVVVALEGDYRSSDEPLEEAVRSLGLPEEFYDRGGTLIWKDGQVLAYAPPGTGREILVDCDRYHTAQIVEITTEDGRFVHQTNLAEGMLSPVDGLSFMVYDNERDRLLGIRTFY